MRDSAIPPRRWYSPLTGHSSPPTSPTITDPFEPPLGDDEEQVIVGANSWARAVFTGTVAHITRNIILLYMVVTKKGLLPRRRGWRPLAGNLFCIISYYCTLRAQINGADKTVRRGRVAAGQPLTGVVSGGSRNQWTHQ